ncbi:hypothetical protein [Flexivirga alba]|uniref:Peptidase M10 metallopeptidase domain-containing protein n=1 Tax=Flexivirga alba TaxID=702742 RepID=A0ABW2ACA0_9MICO
MTDNNQVYYYMNSSGSLELEAGDKSVVRNMLASQYSPTDLQIYYDSTPKLTGTGETDILYQEGDVPGSYNGYTWCDDPVATYVCDQTVVRIEGGGYYKPGLSCHETGHAVGLTHGADAYPRRNQRDSILGCMETPTDDLTPLGANQRNNINAYY